MFVDRGHFEYAGAKRSDGRKRPARETTTTNNHSRAVVAATSSTLSLHPSVHNMWAVRADRVKLTNKQRIRSKHLNLQLDVNALRQQIQQLELHRSLLQTRALFTSDDQDGSVFKTAQYYFHVFRCGYRVAEADLQNSYVQSICDDALSLGVTGLGKDMLVEQWRRYAEYFAFRFISPPVVRVITESKDDAAGVCVVRADTSFHGSFTRQALEMVFPAALRDRRLVLQLLGKEMVTPMSFHLHFNRQGRMVRHDFEADFVTPIASVLGDVARAAMIVQEAKVAEEGMVAAMEQSRLPEPERECEREPARRERRWTDAPKRPRVCEIRVDEVDAECRLMGADTDDRHANELSCATISNDRYAIEYLLHPKL